MPCVIEDVAAGRLAAAAAIHAVFSDEVSSILAQGTPRANGSVLLPPRLVAYVRARTEPFDSLPPNLRELALNHADAALRALRCYDRDGGAGEVAFEPPVPPATAELLEGATVERARELVESGTISPEAALHYETKIRSTARKTLVDWLGSRLP